MPHFFSELASSFKKLWHIAISHRKVSLHTEAAFKSITIPYRLCMNTCHKGALTVHNNLVCVCFFFSESEIYSSFSSPLSFLSFPFLVNRFQYFHDIALFVLCCAVVPQILISLCDVWCGVRVLSVCCEKLTRRRINGANQSNNKKMSIEIKAPT